MKSRFHPRSPAFGRSTLDSDARPLRILILSTIAPYPPHDGTKIQIWQRLRNLAARNDVTLVCVHREKIAEEQIQALTEHCHLHLLEAPPLSRSDTPGRKAVNLLRSFWRRTPYVLQDNLTPPIRAFLDDLVERGSFDVIEADVDAAAFLRRDWRPFKVLIAHSVADAAMRREITMERGLYRKASAFAYWLVMRAYERRTALTADLCATLTPQSEQELRALDPAIRAENCLTNGIDLDYFSYAYDPARPKGACFVGLMGYQPNVDAVLYFCAEILPLVRRRLPDFTFTIVGGQPAPEVKALAGQPGVRVTGYVEDVRPYLREAGVAVIPTRLGGGILNKILEALSMGVPVVTRSRSVEGLDVTSGRELFIADDPAEFADRIVELIERPELRAAMALEGRRHVESRRRWEDIVRRYEQRLREGVRATAPRSRRPLEVGERPLAVSR